MADQPGRIEQGQRHPGRFAGTGRGLQHDGIGAGKSDTQLGQHGVDGKNGLRQKNIPQNSSEPVVETETRQMQVALVPAVGARGRSLAERVGDGVVFFHRFEMLVSVTH